MLYSYRCTCTYKNQEEKLALDIFAVITVNLEIFVVKIFSYSFKATKINFANIFVQGIIETAKYFLQ